MVKLLMKAKMGGGLLQECHSHTKMKQANTSFADKPKKMWIVCCATAK